MKKFGKLLVAAFVLTLGLAFTGCSGLDSIGNASLENGYYGTMEGSEVLSYMYITSDSTGKYGSLDQDYETGEYSYVEEDLSYVIDGNTITVTIGGDSINGTISEDRNTITLSAYGYSFDYVKLAGKPAVPSAE